MARPDSTVPTQDDEIARKLREATVSGELRGAAGYGRPWADDEGWNATPPALRLPFKILKNAGIVPAEVQAMHDIAALAEQVERCTDEGQRRGLQTRLAELRQHLALRLEQLRSSGSL